MTKMAQQRTALSPEELFRDAELKEECGDRRGAFKSLLEAARGGNILSFLNLGNYYSSGIGVSKNIKEAHRWYRRAYRAGQSSGAVNLAIDLYDQGNTRGAIAWLNRAAAMNDGEACVRLAEIYLKRPRSAKVAANLLRRAVSLGPSKIDHDVRRRARFLLRDLDGFGEK